MPAFMSLGRGTRGLATKGAGSACRVVLGAMLICGSVAGPALAQGANAQGLSPSEALNEQQLQALPSASGGCAGAGAPQSLSTFVQQGRVVAGSGCAGGGAVQQVPQMDWVLNAGGLVGDQLVSWGRRAGWDVIWSSKQDWTVPSPTLFHGDFASAASQVLEALSAEGAPLHGVFYQGNHTLVITGGGQ